MTPVVVAIIAALASLAAALFSYRSAVTAQRSADGIDRRRHMIEALDAETDSFRAAVVGYFEALGTMSHDRSAEEWAALGLGRLQVLLTHPLATEGVRSAAANVSGGLGHQVSQHDPSPRSSPANGEALRQAIRAVFMNQANRRRELVEGLSDRPPRRARRK